MIHSRTLRRLLLVTNCTCNLRKMPINTNLRMLFLGFYLISKSLCVQPTPDAGWGRVRKDPRRGGWRRAGERKR